MTRKTTIWMTVGALCLVTATAGAQTPAGTARLESQKQEAAKGVDELAKMAQEMVDSVFSFGELGMQEV